MVTTATMGNPKHDAESRLDSIDFQVKALRELLTNTTVLSASNQPAPVPATDVETGSPTDRFEQTVLATFGSWVLKELAVEGLDVTEKVRAAHNLLSDQLGLRERESIPEGFVESSTAPDSEELFSTEELYTRDEALDVVPIGIRRDSASGLSDETSR